ncbi:MAG: histidine phosphatase family protein [Pseudomonadota bacterium]
MPSLVLVRHGQASFGAENYDQLSDLGRRQAAATGVHLAKLGIKPTQVYSGQLERQKDSALLAMKAMGLSPSIESLEAFNEYDSDGVFKAFLPAVLDRFPAIRDQLKPDDFSLLKDRKIFRTLFFPVLTQWIDEQVVEPGTVEAALQDEGKVLAPNGQPYEPWGRFRTRVLQGVDDVLAKLDEDDCAFVFTSGGTISVTMTYALATADVRFAEFNWRTANASITRFMATDRGLELESYNQYGHLNAPEQQLKVTHL